MLANNTDSRSHFESIDHFHKTQSSDIPHSEPGDTRSIKTRMRMRVPKQYHQEPIISRLISECGLTVNFNAALLGVKTHDDGWFDLELNGRTKQIENALIYLNDLGVEVWSDSTNLDEETW